jgi:NADH pyrophosphatase NudC (nudix superfamily)
VIPFIYRFVYPFFQFYWFVFRPKTQGVICLILSGDELLLIRQTYGRPVWTLSGGGFKKNETKEEAVKREVKEELGLNITPEYLGEFTHQPDYKIDTVFCFVAKIDKVNPKIDYLEIKEAKWWHINDLPKDHSTSLQRVISMYKSR